MLIRILLFFLVLLYFSCSGEKKSTDKKLFTLKAIIDNASKPQSNPSATCQDSVKAMEFCVATAPEFSSFLLTEAIFASILSKNQFINYADYCNSVVSSEMYKNQSDSLKECLFRCDKSYWQTRKNLSICNDSFETMAKGLGTDSGTISCRRNCITWTNNNP